MWKIREETGGGGGGVSHGPSLPLVVGHEGGTDRQAPLLLLPLGPLQLTLPPAWLPSRGSAPLGSYHEAERWWPSPGRRDPMVGGRFRAAKCQRGLPIWLILPKPLCVALVIWGAELKSHSAVPPILQA